MAAVLKKKTDWEINANGETYGSAADAIIPDQGMTQEELYEYYPDLIRAMGDHGREGYVRKSDLLKPFTPNDLDEAIEMHENGAFSGKIPLYEVDGVTQIDTFTKD